MLWCRGPRARLAMTGIFAPFQMCALPGYVTVKCLVAMTEIRVPLTFVVQMVASTRLLRKLFRVMTGTRALLTLLALGAYVAVGRTVASAKQITSAKFSMTVIAAMAM